MQNNNPNGLNQLINYYQELININSQFNDIHDLNRQNANYKNLKSNDFAFVITKSTNDMIAAFNTNYELMKSDITRYDVMLTDHINKSSVNTAEAVEKEHARFTQKIAAESNVIIAGIVDATVSELAKQTELIQSSIKEIDNKQFRNLVVVFLMNICFMFGGAILASNWTVNKIFTHAALVKSKSAK